MNTSLTAYTHLESLLLFQSLHAYGLAPHVFSRVSELLKSNPDITQDKRFESGRLSPDALRNFYLHILKDEIRRERDAREAGESPSPDAKGSRKRKAPSPSLPTVQESAQHQHLIPGLVNRLYARYRAAVTEQIRHDEERHDRLVRELQSVERGEWDAQLKEKGQAVAASRSPSQAKKSPLLHQQPGPSIETAQPAPDGLAERPIPAEEHRPVGPHNVQPPAETTSKSPTSPSQRKKQPPPEKGTASSTPQPPPSLGKGYPSSIPPPNVQHPTSAGQGQNGPPPGIRPPSANGQPQPHLSAQTQNGPPRSPHPPHPQAGPHPGTPQPHPTQPYGHNYGGPPPHFPGTPTHPRYQGQPHLGPQPSGVHTPQQQRHYPPYGGHPPYPPQQQFGHPPPPGGVMLPPFQVSPQDPSRGQQPIHPQYPQASTPVSARQQAAKATPQSTNFGRSNAPPMHHLMTQVRPPVSTPTGIRTPQSGFSTPMSAKSQWKASGKKLALADVLRPEPEPIDDYASTPQQGATKGKPPRKPRGKAKAKEKEQEKEQEPPAESEEVTEDAVPEVELRQGRSRRKAPARRTRPGSIASSQAGTSVRERTRSPSIISHTETVTADNESQAGSRVKSERGTSMDVPDSDLASTPQMTTRRRGHLNASTQAPSTTHKRKRGARDSPPDEPDDPPADTPSALPGLPLSLPLPVIAPRHFSRMCTPLMNDIASHKHASTFTHAVKPKDAEGYYEIIKRPTDLKSIQKAIAAGARQVAAAAAGADTPTAGSSSPSAGGGVLELPPTPENMPPKAIVNPAQLEKEIMRVFVNAVMFNPGEEGVVEDAREMYESVGRSVSSWRSVERSGRLEGEGGEVLGGVGATAAGTALGEEDAVVVKRRKM